LSKHFASVAGTATLQTGTLHVVGVLSKSQLQHLHVMFAGPQNVFARKELAALKQHHEDVHRFKGKV
jgi:hypothetical protein